MNPNRVPYRHIEPLGIVASTAIGTRCEIHYVVLDSGRPLVRIRIASADGKALSATFDAARALSVAAAAAEGCQRLGVAPRATQTRFRMTPVTEDAPAPAAVLVPPFRTSNVDQYGRELERVYHPGRPDLRNCRLP